MTPPKHWIKTDDDTLLLTLTFTDYKHIYTILSMMADKCVELNHHPTIKIDYMVVTIELYTFDEGNQITDLDIQLAEYINEITKLK